MENPTACLWSLPSKLGLGRLEVTSILPRWEKLHAWGYSFLPHLRPGKGITPASYGGKGTAWELGQTLVQISMLVSIGGEAFKRRVPDANSRWCGPFRHGFDVRAIGSSLIVDEQLLGLA